MAEDAITDDGQAPEETQDSPPEAVDSAPVQEDGTRAEQQEAEQDIDWRKRAEDNQAWATKAAQEASQLRETLEAQEAEQAFVSALSNPEQQDAAWASLVEQLGDEGAREWAEGHGFEVEVEDDDEPEFRDPRVDELIAKEQQKEAREFAQRVEKGMEQTLDDCLKEKNLTRDKLPEGVADLIIDAAIARGMQSNDQDVNGTLKAVFADWFAARDADLKAYRQSKRDQPAPPVPGSSGTPNPSLGDRKDRLALANQVAEEALTEP